MAKASSDNEREKGDSMMHDFDKLQKLIGSVDYSNFLVHVYQDNTINLTSSTSNSRHQYTKVYYYTPLALLDIKSIRSNRNYPEDQHEVTFNIEIWNDIIQDRVIHHLQEIFRVNITENHQIQIIPFGNVMLDCTTNKSTNVFWLDFDKKPCNHLPQSITFRLLCPTAEQAEELAQQMRCKPEDFSSLRLHFHLTSTNMPKYNRGIEVNIDLNQQSEIVKQLVHQFKDAAEVLMLNDDAKELFNELASIYQKIYDEKEEESGILELIEKMLVSSREIIEKENQEKWNTTFWRDENKRPDRVCRQINKIRSKLSTEERQKFDSEFGFTEAEAVSTENLTEKRPRDKSVDKTEPTNNETERTRENLGNKKSNKARKAEAAAKRNANQQQSKKSANNKEGNSQENRELRKLLAENRDNIEWDGKKYSPKLVGFLKLNLNKLRSGQSFFTELRNAALHIESSMCMPINIPLLNYKGQSVYEKVNLQKDAIKAKNIEINQLRRELNAKNVRITELNEAVLSRTTSIVIDSADFRRKLRNMSDEQFRACTSILKIEEGRRNSSSTTNNVGRRQPSSDDDSQMEAQSSRSTGQLINRPTNRRFRDLLSACLPCIKSN